VLEWPPGFFVLNFGVGGVGCSPSPHHPPGLNPKGKGPNLAGFVKDFSDQIGLKTEIEFHESGSSGSLKLFFSDFYRLDGILCRLWW
jgi:hypothetical protein